MLLRALPLPQAYRPGHQLPVYAVRWNGLHSRTFLSAGADWKVKLWDSLQPKVGGAAAGEDLRTGRRESSRHAYTCCVVCPPTISGAGC